MTFLEIVNRVLRRLRENQATSVADDPYTKLVGAFVNDAKLEAEQITPWGGQRQTITQRAVVDQNLYTLAGTNQWTKPWHDRTGGRPQAWVVQRACTYDVAFTDGTEANFTIYDNS